MRRRLLLTGVSGFIGSQLAAIPSLRASDLIGVSRKEADLLVPGEPLRLIKEIRPTHLLHLAWYVEPTHYWTSPENTRWVEASAELFRAFAANGGERLVGVGTSAEYDWTYGRLKENETPLRPATLYGESKKRLGEIAMQLGISAAWARLFLVYGPGEPESRFIPTMIRAVRTRASARCEPANAVRDFIHVRDAAAALLAILDSGVQGAVNVGTGVGTTLGAVVDMLGGGDNIERVESGKEDVVVADVGRLTNEVGFRPSFDLRSGLADTIQRSGVAQ